MTESGGQGLAWLLPFWHIRGFDMEGKQMRKEEAEERDRCRDGCRERRWISC
nr:hypothetical protein [uncultured Acetatifactor sp.]